MSSLLRDAAGFTGLAMLGAGLYQYDPRIALIVIGVILLLLAIFYR